MIKIMVDSASDCRKDEFDFFMPINVTIDGNEYRDGVDLERDTFYRLLTECEEFPRTSQPSPDSFAKVFREIKEKGDELIYLCLSSALSGTYQSANIAKAMVDYDKIYIVDTKTASHMIGLIARFAKKLIDAGKPSDTVVKECTDLVGRVKIFAGVDTLEYLHKGGRIGKASAMLGTLANIKPVITVSKEGSVDVAGKALGFLKAVTVISEKLDGFEIDTDFPICTLYTYGEENADKLEAKLSAAGYTVSDRCQIGSTIGAHTGPGVYGVFFVAK